tara:strand:+ start:541 stop:795 length:255 start_codon:yes stop_codon:yes gene_type:complete
MVETDRRVFERLLAVLRTERSTPESQMAATAVLLGELCAECELPYVALGVSTMTVVESMRLHQEALHEVEAVGVAPDAGLRVLP